MNETQSSINKVFSNYKTSEDVTTYDSFDKMDLDKDILSLIIKFQACLLLFSTVPPEIICRIS